MLQQSNLPTPQNFEVHNVIKDMHLDSILAQFNSRDRRVVFTFHLFQMGGIIYDAASYADEAVVGARDGTVI